MAFFVRNCPNTYSFPKLLVTFPLFDRLRSKSQSKLEKGAEKSKWIVLVNVKCSPFPLEEYFHWTHSSVAEHCMSTTPPTASGCHTDSCQNIFVREESFHQEDSLLTRSKIDSHSRENEHSPIFAETGLGFVADSPRSLQLCPVKPDFIEQTVW